MGFFEKKTLKFFKITTCGKFFLECVSNGIFSPEDVFPLYFKGFLGNNQKRIKVGEVEKNDEDRVF